MSKLGGSESRSATHRTAPLRTCAATGLGDDTECARHAVRQLVRVRRHEQDRDAHVLQVPPNLRPGLAINEMHVHKRQVGPQSPPETERGVGLARDPDNLVPLLREGRLYADGNDQLVFHNEDAHVRPDALQPPSLALGIRRVVSGPTLRARIGCLNRVRKRTHRAVSLSRAAST